ncbi:MAG: TonB-dependent receptor, partial [Saprospiraceae bacterium]
MLRDFFRRYWLLGICLCLFSSLSAQQTYLQEKIRYTISSLESQTIEDQIKWLESEKNITISYSSSSINDQNEVYIKEGVYSIEDFLYILLDDFNITLTFNPPDKILILPGKLNKKEINYTLTGYVKDALSNEILMGAVIVCGTCSQYTISNAAGFYSMDIPSGQQLIEVHYLGYKILQKSVDVFNQTQLNLYLQFQNELPELTISRERINYWNFGDQIDAFKLREFKSLLGESDPLNNVKVMPGVQSGGEGQSGLFVRGGGADQNLILFEGIPLYEASHTVGITSLFMEESVREASLIKNGFPARYGGRLSAVMDVHLKEGNSTKHERLISVGIPGVKFHANGPIIKNKTTYNFSARTSWINYYINKFLVPFTNYDEIALNYKDMVGKITHHFKENHKISLSFYTGGDRLSLQKSFAIDTTGYRFLSSDNNRLQWSNTLGSLQWFFTPSAKWSLQVQA